MEYKTELDSDVESYDGKPLEKLRSNSRKNSYVWKFFRALEGSDSYECVICNSCVSNQTSNLARHLAGSHDITKQSELGQGQSKRGRPSRSFIWKYCTKENSKHARCHLCNKLLYFGGGNTANITKHLRRRHMHVVGHREGIFSDAMETIQATKSIDTDETSKSGLDTSDRKERKGSSYVWNYCEKLSRHSVRCNLCNKVMSFHGTANVITHLQRKHNIVGKVDTDKSYSTDGEVMNTLDINGENGAVEHLEDLDEKEQSKRGASSSSIVWKYCTRISKDVVRCGFCNKNLSYQGTSNLQRHLHRMHGVVTQGRVCNDADTSELHFKQINSNFIWEHCSMVDEDKTKCNMCHTIFDRKETTEIYKHLTVTHAIEQRRPGKRKKREESGLEESSDSSEEYMEGNWNKSEKVSEEYTEFRDADVKKDESLYNEFIEEDLEDQNFEEDPFDSSIVQEIPNVNPLSPQSSLGSAYGGRTSQPKVLSEKLKKLNEERVRVETEYFREKAGFYRMQKYLAALQAKKVRNELDRLHNNSMNGAFSVSVEVQPN